jgi:hypothetical protein
MIWSSARCSRETHRDRRGRHQHGCRPPGGGAGRPRRQDADHRRRHLGDHPGPPPVGGGVAGEPGRAGRRDDRDDALHQRRRPAARPDPGGGGADRAAQRGVPRALRRLARGPGRDRARPRVHAGGRPRVRRPADRPLRHGRHAARGAGDPGLRAPRRRDRGGVLAAGPLRRGAGGGHPPRGVPGGGRDRLAPPGADRPPGARERHAAERLPAGPGRADHARLQRGPGRQRPGGAALPDPERRTVMLAEAARAFPVYSFARAPPTACGAPPSSPGWPTPW